MVGISSSTWLWAPQTVMCLRLTWDLGAFWVLLWPVKRINCFKTYLQVDKMFQIMLWPYFQGAQTWVIRVQITFRFLYLYIRCRTYGFPKHLTFLSCLHLNQPALWKVQPVECASASQQKEANSHVLPRLGSNATRSVYSATIAMAVCHKKEATGYREGIRAKLTPRNNSKAFV